MKASFVKIIENIAKLIDLKSIISLMLVLCLCFMVVTNRNVEDNKFLLFSNITTAVITYYFTKKKDDKIDNIEIEKEENTRDDS